LLPGRREDSFPLQGVVPRKRDVPGEEGMVACPPGMELRLAGLSRMELRTPTTQTSHINVFAIGNAN